MNKPSLLSVYLYPPKTSQNVKFLTNVLPDQLFMFEQFHSLQLFVFGYGTPRKLKFYYHSSSLNKPKYPNSASCFINRIKLYLQK